MNWHKYRAKPTNEDGFTRDECRVIGVEYRQAFASKREFSRWVELRLLAERGDIRDLERQVSYRIEINGQLVCTYVADFRYRDRSTGRLIVEDSKGFRTPVFALKARLMKAVHGIEVREV